MGKTVILPTGDGSAVMTVKAVGTNWNGVSVPIRTTGTPHNLTLTATQTRSGNTKSCKMDISIWTERSAMDEYDYYIAGYCNPHSGNHYQLITISYARILNDYPYQGGRMWWEGIYERPIGTTYTTYTDEDMSLYWFQFPYYGTSSTSYGMNSDTDATFEIEADFPIFDSEEHWRAYILSGGTDTTGCINIGEDFDIDDTKLYYIYNKKGQANIFYGNVKETSGSPVWRSMKFYANGRPCFYMTDDTGFGMTLMASRVVSSIGVAGQPYYLDYIDESEWREGELYYTDGFYGDIDKYKTAFAKIPTNGVYTYGLTCDTNIPVFANQDDAEEYLENPDDEDVLEKALNYGDISQFYNPTNPTGYPDTGTEFGQVYTRGFFSRQYILNQTGLAEISNQLFSVGTGSVWETLKKGVELYGDSPSECVQSCIYYPVPLDSMFSGGIGSTNSVFFGSYQMVLENSIAYQIHFPNGHFDLGSFTLRRRYNNWRDYEPYCRCYLYLPYCGTFQLDLARYYNKVTTIRYFVDTRSGSCIACLISGASSTGGHLLDYFNGQMGVQMPITMTDFSRYANNQINTLLGGIQGEKPILQNMTSTLGMLSQAGTGGAGVPMAVGAGVIATMANASKTMYDLTQNNINSYNKTVGGSTSMLNEYLPQRATFLFEYQETIDSPNELLLQGLPSNASGMLSNFSGYLEVESINLVCPIATENEKRSIINQLKAGVIL